MAAQSLPWHACNGGELPRGEGDTAHVLRRRMQEQRENSDQQVYSISRVFLIRRETSTCRAAGELLCRRRAQLVWPFRRAQAHWR